MAVLKTTSPVRCVGAPKLTPSKIEPSSRTRTAFTNCQAPQRNGKPRGLAADRWADHFIGSRFALYFNKIGEELHRQARTNRSHISPRRPRIQPFSAEDFPHH